MTDTRQMTVLARFNINKAIEELERAQARLTRAGEDDPLIAKLTRIIDQLTAIHVNLSTRLR